MGVIIYSACPVCASNNIQQKLSAKDYTVSGEVFEIWQCNNCQLRFTQNVPGENEIGSYYQAGSYISHTNTKQGIINKLYHAVRKHTLNTKKNLIQKVSGLQTGHLLDVGAGTAAFINTMQMAGWRITGIEPDEATRKRAAELHAVVLLQQNALFKLPAQHYDVVTMWHVLEHVQHLHEYIAQIKKILKPGGKLLIAVPNYTSKDAGIYKQHWAAYDVPRHLYHFSPNSIKILMQQHGLQVKNMKPMWFDSFYIAMLSQQYKNGKNNLPVAVLNGLLSNLAAVGNVQKCSSVIYIVEKLSGW
jgi:2-polyprenyl-3-methyl-5-hydroxy-6-metoxy-1,4-benzoquinol methylase